MEHDGSFYVSVLYAYEAEIIPIEVCYNKVLGLDYKSDGLYMDSDGKCAHMPHFYRVNQKKLAKAQHLLWRFTPKQEARDFSHVRVHRHVFKCELTRGINEFKEINDRKRLLK